MMNSDNPPNLAPSSSITSFLSFLLSPPPPLSSSFSLIPSSMAAVVLGDQSEVEKHLAEGKKLLQEGQLSDALHHYTAAVGENHRYSVRYI